MTESKTVLTSKFMKKAYIINLEKIIYIHCKFELQYYHFGIIE